MTDTARERAARRKAGATNGDSGSAASPVDPPRPRKGSLEDRLNGVIATWSVPFFVMGDVHCTTVLAERGPIMAHAWAELARENPRVRAILERMMQGGAWGMVVTSTLGVAIPIAQHHGAPLFGGVDPFALVFGPIGVDEPADVVNDSPNGTGEYDSPVTPSGAAE